MAYSRVSSAALAALFTLFPGDFQAASFVAPSPHLVIGKVAAVQKNNQQTHHVVPSTSSEEVQLPPKDGSFGLIGTVRHLLALPDVPKNAKKYDRIGHETGGIWRSAMMGVEACTIAATQQSKKWLVTEEAAGNVVQESPQSSRRIFGPKALMNMGMQPKGHAVARKAFSKSLSPKATLALQPVVELSLGKRMRRWEKFAASGKEIALASDIQAYTLDVIAYGFLGDYATENIVAEIKRLLPVLSRALFSVPRGFPWPLNKVPILGFQHSMDARKEFQTLLAGVIRERRSDLTREMGTNKATKNCGLVDELLKLQKEQMDAGGPGEGGVILDDDFICDNVILGLFAGYGSTAVTLMRIVQLLASVEGKEIVGQLMVELREAVAADDDKLDEQVGGYTSTQASGIFREFPLLDAVVLEANRIYPALGFIVRKSVNGANYNGYSISAGQTIYWSLLDGFRAESLYPDSTKFCPFRFIQGHAAEKRRAAMLQTGDAPVNPGMEQLRPEIFGFGRHMCPGRELAKLEILLFLRTFLEKFDYELVDRQNFKGTMPNNEPKGNLRVVLKAKATT